MVDGVKVKRQEKVEEFREETGVSGTGRRKRKGKME